jgi:HEPN domain-containing protein
MSPEQVQEDLVRQWIAKAAQDMEAAEILLSRDQPLIYAVCFHAQQAVEKYLKAYLTRKKVEFPKTHDIEQLLDLAAKADSAFAETLRAAAALSPYSVDIRYPGDAPEPNEEEAKQALTLARVVQSAVSDILKET